MADRYFRRREVDGLVRKLGEVEPSLTARERELLLAIFEAAALVTEPAGLDSEETLAEAELRRERGEGEVTLADLRLELIDAFIPDDEDMVRSFKLKIHPAEPISP